MTTTSTNATHRQGHVKASTEALAKDVGLNHELGPDRARHSLKQTVGKLFDRVQGLSRKKR